MSIIHFSSKWAAQIGDRWLDFDSIFDMYNTILYIYFITSSYWKFPVFC